MKIFTHALIATLLVHFAVIAQQPARADEKKADARKDAAEPLTKDKVLGKWKGKLANGSVEVWLRDESAVVTFEFTGGGLAIGNVGPFKIDDKKNEVQFGGATAKPTKDGALLMSGQITMGLNTYNVPETRGQPRIKTADPKK